MQAREGKAARKCDEIASTPTRGKSAELTPNLKATEQEQAQAKKIKKKGLEEFFGKGPRVQPPSREGTSIDVVVKKRGNKNKANDHEERARQPNSGEAYPRPNLPSNCNQRRMGKEDKGEN